MFFSQNRIKWVLCLFLVFGLFACASPKKVTKVYYDPRTFFKEHDVKSLPRFDIPIDTNERVIAWIEYFQGPGRRHFEKYLRRSGRYLPMMREILRQEKVPEDLVYISMIESGFSPHAYSSASAVGLWQFIGSTGRMYGLRSDGWTDSRREPFAATRAAAKHFRDLYEDFGDWYLAMAAYNAGPLRVTRAIRMTGSRNFWDLARHRQALRPETRDYVPKFIAAAIISKMPEQFGFGDIEYEAPLEFDTGTVDSQTDLAVIAECACVDYDTIKDLNPHLYRGSTPPSGDFEIRLPKGKAQVFREKYASLPDEKKMKFVYHRVRKGDTLAKVARRYGLSKEAIVAANNISAKKGLRRGTTLLIPTRGTSYAKVGGPYESSSKVPHARKLVYHKAKKGETASGIAELYGVKVSQLKAWNGMGRKSHIRSGQTLKLYQPIVASKSAEEVVTEVAQGAAEKEPSAQVVSVEKESASDEPVEVKGKARKMHTVKRGESAGKIAGRYGITTGELIAWNRLNGKGKIIAGQKLVVSKPHAKLADTTAVDLTEKESKVALLEEKLAKAGVPVQVSSSTRSTGKSSRQHVVRKGETIGKIASINRVSTKNLMAWNNVKDPRKLRVGQKLKIPTGAVQPAEAKPVAEETTLAGDLAADKSVPNASVVPQTEVQTNEAMPVKLSSIGVPASNDFVYDVRNGDTLWDIARRHKVTIAEIQRWNNLNDPSAVKPGTKLTIKR